MAAGDINSYGTPVVMGNVWRAIASIEVDDTHRAYDLVPKGTIVSASVSDTDGAGSAEVDINENAAGTTDNGSIAVNGNHVTVNTYNVDYTFIM